MAGEHLSGSARSWMPVGAVWYLIARDTPEQHPYASAGEQAPSEKGLAAKPGRTPPSRISALLRMHVSLWFNIARSLSVWSLTFSYFTYGYVAWISSAGSTPISRKYAILT